MNSQQEKEAGPKSGAYKIHLSPCKGCGQPIHYVETLRGRRMPCNERKLTVITMLGDVVSGWEAHFATCPQADKFRKKKQTEAKNGF